MKKITGKALSLVLSIALVASSFSASFASASTKTVTGSVDLQKDDAKTIYLVSGGKDSGVCLTDWINGHAGSGVTMDTPDHQDSITIDQIIDVSHVSGDRLVKWGNVNGNKISDDNNDPAYLFLKNNSESGKEVISVLYKGSYPDDDGNDVTIKAKADFTVNVAKEGTIYVGKYYKASDLANRKGKSIEDVPSMSQKADQLLTGGYVDSTAAGVYTVFDSTGDNECLAAYAPVSTYFDTPAATHTGAAVTSASASYFTVKTSGSVASKCAILPDSTATNKLNIWAGQDVGTGSLTLSATHTSGNGTNANKSISSGSVSAIVADAGLSIDAGDTVKVNDDKVSGKATVEKRVLVTKPTTTSVYKDKKTYMAVSYNTDGKIDVTNYDIKLAGPSTFTVGDKSVVGKITNDNTYPLTNLKADSATIDSIKLDDNSTTAITLNDTKVGAVDAADGSIDITGGTAGDVKSAGSSNAEIKVHSGNVGDITCSDAVTIEASDDDKTTTVGNIKSDGVTSIDNMDSKVNAKSYTAKDPNATLKLAGDSISIGKIDMDYRDATLSFDDFQGKLASPINAKNASIETTDSDDVVSFTGAATIDTLDMQDDTSVTFDSTLKANYVTGSGSLKLPLGGLYVVDGVSGSPILKFSNDFKVGDTAFKADSDAVEEDDFDTFGFTVSKSAGTTTDTFKIASAKFAGLVIAPSSARIAKGTQYAQTFKASAYPSGTVIPTGDKIAWDFSGNDTNFKTTANADGTYTVEVIAVDPTFTSENTGDVIAKLQDADGNDDTDFDQAKCSVTALAVPDATFTSDTGATLTVPQGGNYTFKITSVDGKEPTFSVGSNAFTVTKLGKSGNAYFFKITATGAVKTSVGVYVNGVRSTVATIGASTVKIDTTKLSLKTGASYTFKVSGTSVKPSFTSGNTAVVKVVSSSVSAGNYFFKVTGEKAGSTGIYVNGVRAAVVTVA